MSETTEHEKAMAKHWFNEQYPEYQVKLLVELQGINFKNVQYEYGLLYEEQERAGGGKWN